MLRGVNTLANAVKVTLGPKGRNVVIEKSYGAPRTTKDGVTVAKEIELDRQVREPRRPADPRSRLQDQRQGRRRHHHRHGPGPAIVVEGMKVGGRRHEPDGSEAAASTRPSLIVVDAIKATSKKVTTNDEIAQVGAISANGDKEIGDMIAKAMEKVGNEGVITVEEAKTRRDRTRRRRGHAVRPRLSLALLRHQRRQDGGPTRGRADPAVGEEAVLRCSPCFRLLEAVVAEPPVRC